MLEVGAKLKLKQGIDDLFEIVGIFPGGQGGSKLNLYNIVIDGEIHLLDQKIIDFLFYNAEKKVIFVPNIIKEDKEAQIDEKLKTTLDEILDRGDELHSLVELDQDYDDSPKTLIGNKSQEEKRRGRPAKTKS